MFCGILSAFRKSKRTQPKLEAFSTDDYVDFYWHFVQSYQQDELESGDVDDELSGELWATMLSDLPGLANDEKVAQFVLSSCSSPDNIYPDDDDEIDGGERCCWNRSHDDDKQAKTDESDEELEDCLANPFQNVHNFLSSTVAADTASWVSPCCRTCCQKGSTLDHANNNSPVSKDMLEVCADLAKLTAGTRQGRQRTFSLESRRSGHSAHSHQSPSDGISFDNSTSGWEVTKRPDIRPRASTWV